MMAEFGRSDLEGLSDFNCDTRSKATKKRIADLPTGASENENVVDGYGAKVRIKVRLSVEGARLRADFTGSSGLFSFLFKPCSDARMHAFVDAPAMFGVGVSWGGYESLVLPVAPIAPRGQGRAKAASCESAMASRRPTA